MVRLARCSGLPPAARSASSTLARACSNCATIVSPTMAPSAPWAIWPARKTSRPPVVTTACEKPEGRGRDGGFTRSSSTWLASRIPPGVPGARLALPDQLQPGTRPVGAPGLRRPAPGPPRVGPRGGRAIVALLGRGVQGPVRVVEVGPAQGAQVGPAGQDDRVHVVVGGDHADRDGGDARLVADRVRERRLVRPAEGRLL